MKHLRSGFDGLSEVKAIELDLWHRPAVPITLREMGESSLSCPFADGKYEDRDLDVCIEDFN